MSIKFIPQTHKYESIDPSDNTVWTSVTTAISKFKKPFDGNSISEKVARSTKSKWYGMTPAQIREVWKKEADRACDLGNFYHDRQEANFLACNTISRYGIDLPVIRSLTDQNGYKIASSQRLIEGIYPEHLVYLKSAGLVGQSDLVEVAHGHVHVSDYKTNKEIKKESYVNWEGTSDKMLGVLSHLDDCNFNHYNIQLSIYMYMVLKHNPRLKPGSLTVQHVIFEEEGRDQYDYPISKLDENGDPIVKDVVLYPMSYLEQEAHNVVEHIKSMKLQQVLW
jgi:hypothetical protein